jgi:hypothetical protein
METGQADCASCLKALPTPAGKKKAFKIHGLDALPHSERVRVESHIEHLARYGFFIVPVGELERWLPELGVTSKKKANWIVAMFAELGSDPADPDYVRAASGGIWDFLDRVATWTDDPARLGMP